MSVAADTNLAGLDFLGALALSHHERSWEYFLVSVTSLALHRVRSRVTRRGRRAIIEDARGHRESLAQLMTVSTVPGLDAKFRRLCIQTAYRDLRDFRIFKVAYFALGLLAMAPIILILTFQLIDVYAPTFIASVVVLMIVATIIRLLNAELMKAVRILAPTLGASFIVIFLWTIVARTTFSQVSASEAVDMAVATLSGWLIAASWCFLLLASLAVALSTVAALTDAIEEYSSPETTIFGLMLRVGAFVSDESDFSDPESRREAMDKLERVARCIERGLTRRWRVPSSTLNRAIDFRMRGAAAAIREREVWIALPGQCTRRDLVDFSARFLETVASGKYDELPLGELPENPKRRLRAAVNVIRSILGAVLPISIVAIAGKYTRLLPEGATRVAIFVVASLLAVVSIMSLIDPGFVRRITTAKDLVTMLKDTKGA